MCGVESDCTWSQEVGSCEVHKEGSLQSKILLKVRSHIFKKKSGDVGTHLCVFIFMCLSVLSSHRQVYHMFALFHRGQKRASVVTDWGYRQL